MLSWRTAAVIGGTFVVCTSSHSIQAQTGPRIAWDGQVAPAISGYAVTIDGVRTNYGTTPVINGACGCSIPAPFSGGRHTIVVIAYNSSGETPSAPLTVGPVANAGGPYAGTPGVAVAVTASGSVAPTGSLTNYTWRWGDGTADTSTSSTSASHVYSASGTFTVTLTVRDNAGATASASTTATIASAAQTPTALPTPWLTQDIGSVGLVGSASHSSGRFTVAGAGADIWGTADAFRFVYQPLTADGQIVARVTSMQNTHSYAKAGVMIRQSLTADSAHALVNLIPSGQIEFLARPSAAASTVLVAMTSQAPPTWLKLSRSGGTIVASVSADGASWSVVGTTSISMTSPVQIGLAVTSHTTSALNTSVFDNVTVTTGSSTQPPATPSSPTPGNGATGVALTSSLTWSSVGATSYDVSFGTTNPPPQVAPGLTTASYAPPSMAANTQYYWRVVARNSRGTTTGPVWSFTTAPKPSGGGVPSSWVAQDVGPVSPTGSASFASGTFSVNGGGSSGNGRWRNADALHFVHRPMSENGEIVARVTAMENTNSNAKAGVMFRATLDPGSPQATLNLTPGGGIQFIGRSSSDQSTILHATASQTPPAWLKLVKSGSSITGFVSSNGSTWTQVGSTTISLGSTPYAGLAVTSYDNDTLNTATFDSVTVTGSSAPPPPPPTSGDVVIYASDIPASARHGSWQTASDPLSPNLVKLRVPDNGAPTVSPPLASPTHYVDVTFNAAANTPYRFWIRMRAEGNSGSNDSLYVQFSDALAGGNPVFRTNTTSAMLINLDTGVLLDWGWTNSASWVSQPTTFTFPSTGMHTIRIQVREDGVQFDQIVLSPSTYLNSPPGPAAGDSTIVPKE
jgi:regulation of enolase protein 1 (concanavalin A-like superfamily)